MKPTEKSRTSKIATVVFGAIVCFSLCGVGAAFADNNHTDIPFGFRISTNDAQATQGASKTDDSSSWIDVQTLTGKSQCTAEVYARTSMNGSLKKVGSERYFVSQGSQVYMSNYVYERGYRVASIVLTNPIGVGGNNPLNISGFWSPDSV